LSGGYYGDTYIYNSGDADAGETIVEPTSGTEIDKISMVTSTIFSNMTASSFDEIEAISLASGQVGTFTGLQLTGEVIAFSGTAGGTETLTVNIGAGHQFTSLLTNAAGDINLVEYIGSTSDETIVGGDMTEVITGGTGNDVLSGGAGNDTFMFNTYTSNGLDRITLSTTSTTTGGVTTTVVDDKLNFSSDTFINEGTPKIGIKYCGRNRYRRRQRQYFDSAKRILCRCRCAGIGNHHLCRHSQRHWQCLDRLCKL
jgi:Ca2+-binding RTX toxin-like protein